MALNDKRATFVEEYLKTFNRTQAALNAGYSPRTAYSIGANLMKDEEVKQAISARLTETAMSADEVMRRLAEQARGSMADFWNIPANGSPVLDLTTSQARAHLHLIKKMKVKTTTKMLVGDGAPLPEGKEPTEGKEPVLMARLVTTEIDFELYDAQAALQLIGKHHGAFTEAERPVEVDINVNVSESLRSRVDSIASRLRTGSGAQGTGADQGR